MKSVLKIDNLYAEYNTDHGCVKAVSGISLNIGSGETLGLVGETGAGKTTTALAILRLLPNPPGRIVLGNIFLDSVELTSCSEKELQSIRGKRVSMIFQDPMTALNPVIAVGDQIAEVIRHHEHCTKADGVRRACEMLEMVGISAERYKEYPHQFSGGMKQRIVIAIALACSPELLIADEPTTALDVTIQAQVLDLIARLQKKTGTAVLLITHDLGVVAECCQRVAVMYAGEIVECGPTEELYETPSHPYTTGLFQSIPSLEKVVRRLQPIPGAMPDPTKVVSGCSFAPRCANVCEICKVKKPPVSEIRTGHTVRCWRYFKNEDKENEI